MDAVNSQESNENQTITDDQEVKVQTTRHHVPVLDGLRAVACLLVIIAHLPFKFFSPEAKVIDQILRPGYLGVGLFFVLSGFLITRILMYNRDRGVSLKSFYIKRSARIFPIYYLTIIAVAFFQPGTYLWFHALYLNNIPYFFGSGPNPIGHSWSLAVEEHFYLAWPLIITFVPLRWLQFAIVKVAILGFALAFLFPVFIHS